MRRFSRISILLSLLLALSIPSASFAAETATPSPRPSQTVTPTKQVLTPAQREAIALARSNFAAAKANAQDGFDRAIADAKALRDQAILDAGSDKTAIAAAKKAYRDSYRTIVIAYRTDMKNAKAELRSALAKAYSLRPSS